jgi:hypothetical protein
MARCFKICNLNFGIGEAIEEFEIDGYKFIPTKDASRARISISSNDRAVYYRSHRVTCKVTIPGDQADSIIFRDGRITDTLSKSTLGRRRKCIEDIILLISLLIGRNVVLYSRRNMANFQRYPTKP